MIETTSILYGILLIVIAICNIFNDGYRALSRLKSPFTSSFFFLWNSLGLIDLTTIFTRFIFWFMDDHIVIEFSVAQIVNLKKRKQRASMASGSASKRKQKCA